MPNRRDNKAVQELERFLRRGPRPTVKSTLARVSEFFLVGIIAYAVIATVLSL